MALPYGLFCGLVRELPRLHAEADLRALTVAHTGDAKDLADRLRARAYPETAWYNSKGSEATKAAWDSLMSTARSA